MANRPFALTGRLIRLNLRQDRLRILVWVLSFTVVTLLVANAFTGLYGSEPERQAVAGTMVNPAMTAMVGKGYGLDNYTIGAMLAHQMLLMTAVVVGIMSIMLVTHHSRGDEEDGRIEMLRSLPVGRLSPLQSTVLVVFGTNVLLAVLIGVGLVALGMEGVDLEGSLLYGAGLGAIGIWFAALAAVFAQLSENSRGALGLSIGVLLISYLVRAIGDVSAEALSWFSPLGWVTRTQAYVNNNWWPVLLILGTAGILLGIAYRLNAGRDLGAGLIPSKPGRRRARRSLLKPLGLELRLQRTGLISWAAGMYVLGASYGSVLGDLDSFFAENEMVQELLTPVEGYSLTEQFISFLMVVIAIFCTIPALMAILKLRGEEKKNRTEYLLVRAVSRGRLIGNYVMVSVLAGAGMFGLAAVGLASAGGAGVEEGITLGTFMGAGYAYFPAAAVMVGLATLLIGVAPKWTGLVWAYLIYSFFVVYLGGLLQVPDWMLQVTPYGHVSKLPVEDLDVQRSVVLLGIAGVLMAVGIRGYRKRDLEG